MSRALVSTLDRNFQSKTKYTEKIDSEKNARTSSRQQKLEKAWIKHIFTFISRTLRRIYLPACDNTIDVLLVE